MSPGRSSGQTYQTPRARPIIKPPVRAGEANNTLLHPVGAIALRERVFLRTLSSTRFGQ